VVTEHHLPFGHTPSYVTTSGWIFHTIQAPFKKDKDGNPTLGTRGGIFLATRKNTFAISEKNHHHTDLYQTATWTLSAGKFLPIIHITGVYLTLTIRYPPQNSRTFTLPSTTISMSPPRIPHRTSIVITIIYLLVISTVGWVWNKNNTSPTTSAIHTFPPALGTPIRDDNLKIEFLTQRQPPHTLGSGVDYY